MIAYHGWRARPGFGAAKGLPPGSLARLPVRPWSDPEFYKRQATRYGSIFKMCQLWQPMICIVGLDRVNRLLLEHDQQLVAPPLPFSRFIEGGYLRYLPEETHAKYRRFFGMLFYSEVVTHAEPRIADAFARGLAAMADVSGRDGGVPVRAPTMRMMFVAWAELFYGIGDRHRRFPATQSAVSGHRHPEGALGLAQADRAGLGRDRERFCDAARASWSLIPRPRPAFSSGSGVSIRKRCRTEPCSGI